MIYLNSTKQQNHSVSYLLCPVDASVQMIIILDSAEPLDGQPPPPFIPDSPTGFLRQLMYTKELGCPAEDEGPHGLVPVQADPRILTSGKLTGVRPDREMLLLLLLLLLLHRAHDTPTAWGGRACVAILDYRAGWHGHHFWWHALAAAANSAESGPAHVDGWLRWHW